MFPDGHATTSLERAKSNGVPQHVGCPSQPIAGFYPQPTDAKTRDDDCDVNQIVHDAGLLIDMDQ